MKRLILSLFWAAIAILICSPSARGMGEERVGNAPLPDSNYTSWEGIVPVVNDKQRVYYTWVNGNESFYFSGTTADLNEALADFAKVKGEVREVILRPGPAKASSFGGDKQHAYQWSLRLLGGIAKAAMQRQHLSETVWPLHPVIEIQIDGSISLDKLVIPKGIRVSQIADLQARYAKAFESESTMVRGWSCSHIAELDRYNSASMYRVAKRITDEDEWVRSNAIPALAKFGATAKPALGILENVLQSENQKHVDAAKQAIEMIEKASEDVEAKKLFQERLVAIAEFCTKRGQ